MTENVADDNASMNSDDSTEANAAALREKLEYLVKQEAKHSHNYYELHKRNQFTRLDIKNLNNSCQRYEEKLKKKSEKLEESYSKLAQCQKKNMAYLKDKLAATKEKLEQINSLFHEAYQDYKSDALLNTISYLDNQKEQFEKELTNNTEILNSKQCEMNESLMKLKSDMSSPIDYAINFLSEFSMKSPEIELKEIASKLEDVIIPDLKKQLQEYKSKLE